MARLSVVGLLVAMLPLLFVKCERQSNVQSILAGKTLEKHNRFSRLREIDTGAARDPTVDATKGGIPEKTESIEPHHTYVSDFGYPKDIDDKDPVQQEEEPPEEDDDDEEDETTEEQEEPQTTQTTVSTMDPALTDPPEEDDEEKEEEPEEEEEEEPEDDVLDLFTTSTPPAQLPNTSPRQVPKITPLEFIDPISTATTTTSKRPKKVGISTDINPNSTSSPPISKPPKQARASTDINPNSTSSPPISKHSKQARGSPDINLISTSSPPISKYRKKARGSNAGKDEKETHFYHNTTTVAALLERKNNTKYGGGVEYIYPLASRTIEPKDNNDLDLPNLTTTPLEVFYPGETLNEADDNSDWHDDEEILQQPIQKPDDNYVVQTKAKRLVILPLSDDEPDDQGVQGPDPEAAASKHVAQEIEGEMYNIIDTYEDINATNTTFPPDILPVADTTTNEKQAKIRQGTTTKKPIRSTTKYRHKPVEDTVILHALDNALEPEFTNFGVLDSGLVCSGSQGCLRGTCVNGKCLCDEFWVGDRCNVRACVATCPKGTRCQDGKCQKCKDGDCGSCENSCGPHGRCVHGSCYCKYGFGGPQCTRPICPTNPQCSGHGACLIGVCICDKGFAGIACHKQDSVAPALTNMAKLERTRLHSLLNDNEKMTRAAVRSVYRSQLAELESEIKNAYVAINKCLGSGSSDACGQIKALRQQALALNIRHKKLLLKMTQVEEDATIRGHKFRQQENMQEIRELAFAIFANERRVSVKAGMYGISDKLHYTSPNATAIDAKLAQMWKELSAEEVVLYVDLAKDTLAAERRAWAVAHELFVDEQLANSNAALTPSNSLRGAPPSSEKNITKIRENIDKDWAVLPSEKRLEYYVNSSHLAFQVSTNSSKFPPRKSFSMLGTATNNLAFDLFAKSQWLPAFDRLSKGRDKGQKRVAMLAAVDQNVLAQYRNLEPKMRLAWLDKAKEVLYPKILFWQKWQNSSSHLIPMFQVIGFQIGLRESTSRRSKNKKQQVSPLKSLTDTLEEVVQQITRGSKFELIAFDAVHTTRASQIFSFVLVLASNVHSTSTKLVHKLSASVNSGSFHKSLVTHGVQTTPYIPAGGEPHIVYGYSIRPKCPLDYKCSRGACMNGICSCPSGYAGHDCSQKVSCDCSPDHGLCDHLTGRCECFGSWTGKRCDALACPNDCNGQGMCSNGTCICNALYKGPDCSERTCQSECSGHGRCCFHYKCKNRAAKPKPFLSALEHIIGISEGKRGNFEALSDEQEVVSNNPDGFTVSPTCVCQKGYGGGSCGCLSEIPEKECSGHGICFENQCWCRAGFFGPSCSQATCTPNDCSGHGQCLNGACICSPGWASNEPGGGCDKKVCLDERCSGHGSCKNGECQCSNGWEGVHCEKPVCPGEPQCSGHGVCVTKITVLASYSECECTGEWYGELCEERRCFRDAISKLECNGKGTCKDNTCVCDFGWVGPTCSTEICPNNCNWPWGRCVDGRYCECNRLHRGLDCSEQISEEELLAQPAEPAPGANKSPQVQKKMQKALLAKKKKQKKQKKQMASSDDEPKADMQALRGCAACCSKICEDNCHDKSRDVAPVYSFPDCFFGCQKWCVRDCATTPTLSCRRPSYYLQINGPGAPFPHTEAHSELQKE